MGAGELERRGATCVDENTGAGKEEEEHVSTYHVSCIGEEKKSKTVWIATSTSTQLKMLKIVLLFQREAARRVSTNTNDAVDVVIDHRTHLISLNLLHCWTAGCWLLHFCYWPVGRWSKSRVPSRSVYIDHTCT